MNLLYLDSVSAENVKYQAGKRTLGFIKINASSGITHGKMRAVQLVDSLQT